MQGVIQVFTLLINICVVNARRENWISSSSVSQGLNTAIQTMCLGSIIYVHQATNILMPQPNQEIKGWHSYCR